MPQHLRGIRLRELFAICEDNLDWMEEMRWRCGTCHRSCSCEDCTRQQRRQRCYLAHAPTESLLGEKQGAHGPCLFCGGGEGKRQMRNLYEVNAEVIKPRCEHLRISFVEALRAEEAEGRWKECMEPALEGVRVDTFVSHWWGEEFPLLVRTLKKYAKWRCDAKLQRKRVHTEWSFWICAFANNQFAVEHATGLGGDVATTAFAVALQNCSEMVAVIDPEAMIYSRVWCTFELFYAHSLPHKPKIALANAGGVFSSGSATRATVLQMHELLSRVRVSEAKATVPADRDMIMHALAAAGVSTRTLDGILCSQVEEGLRMVCLRAKFFSQLACFFLSTMVAVMVLLGVIFEREQGAFIQRWSRPLEWAILLHLPLLSSACVLFVFLVTLSFSGAKGRALAVDWMWLFGGLGPTMWRAILRQDAPVKMLGLWAVLNSLVAALMCVYAELKGSEWPSVGGVHQRPAKLLAVVCAVLCLETFVLDMRLSPNRYRLRLVFIELFSSAWGAVAGLVAHSTESRFVVLVVLLAWVLIFCAAFLRDHLPPRIRRRIEEPFWT